MVTNSRVDACTKIIDALAKYYPADSNKIDLNLDKLDSEISFIYDYDDLDAKDGLWTDDEINARLDFEHDVDIQCAINGLFHWTEDNVLFVSNLDSDKSKHDKYAKSKFLESKFYDKILKINKKLQDSNLTSTKRKALELEKESYQNLEPSEEAVEIVNNLLHKSNGKIICDVCKANGLLKYVQNDRGLIIHKSRVHSNKIKHKK
ncbi:unnamed protein product [Brachionus calyciflorus]|uniref:Uncharacterized protein n=1 Tax=Brachionus calyciflorus TaxID=104777 RepID=A0A813ULH5_9BILA|nr:unnamed protein product [Brachionus calyciflorus]